MGPKWLTSLIGKKAPATWRDFYWYHCVDLGNGVITDGDYDMREYLEHYHFPHDLSGKQVLDVGRASGFFSFEFERRGADVTATEIASYFDWDFVGGEPEKLRRIQAVGDVGAFNQREITGAFFYAHKARKSKVRPKTLGVYDVTPGALGQKKFDLVFAGSITSHLRDPILGLERLRSVTAGKCIVAVPSFSGFEPPAMSLVATHDSDRRSWWVINRNCLIEMLLCAGFSRVEIVSEFVLIHRKRADQRHPHLVAHAWA